MCALQAGQIVELAAELTSCFALHSKHSICELVCRPQRFSNFRRIGPATSAAWAAGFSTFTRNFGCGFGVEGE
jgi:hypothetical protein